jgi:hypothetical protein
VALAGGIINGTHYATSTSSRSGAQFADSQGWLAAQQRSGTVTSYPGRMSGGAGAMSPDGGVWAAGGMEKVGNQFFPVASDAFWVFVH